MVTSLPSLPIDEVLPEVLRRLGDRRRLVLEAPPGAGKTTRVPPAIDGAGLAGGRAIVVLEPRRLAARLAAVRVAAERDESVGDSVGYQVRFEDVSGPRTRIRFMTEGILSRQLLTDPTLAGVGVVILDEFHERHLATDVSLARLVRLQAGPRPDLALVVMSATLDGEAVASFLDAPRVQSSGRMYPVAIEHLPQPDDRPLEAQVERALRRCLAEGLDGDVLVFLPGAAEIRRASEACAEVAARQDLLVVPLHGDLPPEEQDRAVRPAPQRKVILSTNVAETSVTIPGVTVVIDGGLARVASHSPVRGLPSLRVAKISRASAAQRAGRAGRTAPGRALRLYTRHDHDARPAFETPEVRRLDLAETVLELRAGGIDPRAFGWFEAPDPAAVDAAEALLERLGALGPGGEVTETGRQLLRFPVHPRLGRLLVEAARHGVAEDAAALAALLGERELRAPRDRRLSGRSDPLEALEDSGRGTSYAVGRARRQLARLASSLSQRRPEKGIGSEEALLRALLAAYPDRVARRRRPRAPEVLLSSGGAAVLAEQSVVRDAEMMVAVDVEARPRAEPLVRAASAIEPEWLIDLCPERVRESSELSFQAATERIEVVSRLTYDALVLHEDRRPAQPSPEVGRALAQAARARGPEAFADPAALQRLRTRIELVATGMPEAGLSLDDDEVLAALEDLCATRRSFAELREADLLAAIVGRLTGSQASILARAAPERVTLPGGRSTRIEYEPGKPPHLESYLQDFFGMAQGPSVCEGRVPVVLHLLAPNRRAVQVTTDLAGFWTRHYPAVRKELSRRYPRHAWPEDPRTAAPPRPRGRQSR